MGLLGIEDLANPILAMKILKYDIKTAYYAGQTKKLRKQIEEEKKKKEQEEEKARKKEAEELKVEAEVVEEPKIRKFAAVSNIVFNESTGLFEFTEPKDDLSMFDKDIIDVPFVEDVPDLEDDDIENIITYVIRDVKKLNPDMNEALIRNTVLTVLFLTDMISAFQMHEHKDFNHPDNDTEINSIAKFLSDGYKVYIATDCYDISEFMTMKELKDIINSIDTKLNWTGNSDYIEIVEAVRKGYTANKVKEELFNGVMPEDEEPVLFNSTVISQPFDPSLTPIAPVISNKVLKYLKARISHILREDKNFTFELTPATDNYNPNYIVRDIAQVVIKCTDNRDGSYCLYSIDLNTIVGNGYNLIVPSNFNGILQDIYVNIEKHPDIIRRILTTNYQFRFNPTNMLDLEFKSVMQDCLPYNVIYRQYDFSNMYKHLKDMSEEDRVIFANNLMGIINLNWFNVNPGFTMPRFRFRAFTDARRFILVSDKNVRVQSSNWMAEPFSLYAKQYINTPGFMTDDSEFVVDLNNNEIHFYMNKAEIDL